MELKTKYQYTYFIYPYIVKESRYDKYLLKLLRDKKCKLKIFEKERDLEIYNYFLPTVREYMFKTFDFTNENIKDIYELNQKMASKLLSKNYCTIFEYDLGDDVQGKAGIDSGIFFKIQKIEIICFKTGICFLNIKTNVEGSNNFSDVLDFNYKFREINSELKQLKEYENIKIQTNSLSDIKKLSEIIKEIAGSNSEGKKLDIDTNTFLTYSYVCLEQEYWKEIEEFKNIKNEFFKYTNVLPSNYNSNIDAQNLKIISKSNYMKIGLTKMGVNLISSGKDTMNYTRLPHSYENEYLYSYILTIYKKIYLNKISKEFEKKSKFEGVRKKFVKFTKNIWINESTNEEFGSNYDKELKQVLEIQHLYNQVKDKYDVLYKEFKIDKNIKINKVILIALIISLIMNIINFITVLALGN